MFGMKMPRVRTTTALREDPKGGYAVYANDRQSAEDMLLYFQMVTNNALYQLDECKDPASFVNFLKSKAYFEDSPTVYTAGVSAYYNS